MDCVFVALEGTGEINAALLDPGSTCSSIRADVADQLNLDGPPTS